jgi:hypothetical protein
VIFMQNFGAVQTYSAHEQVGLYAGAAILVGGASIKRATNGQAGKQTKAKLLEVVLEAMATPAPTAEPTAVPTPVPTPEPTPEPTPQASATPETIRRWFPAP